MAISVTLAAGVLIGLLLGVLGAGGSIIAVPLLTVCVGLPLREAIVTALVVVLASSVTAVLPRLRTGVQWRTAGIMAAVGMPFTLLGTALGQHVNDDVLAVGFVVVMLAAAVLMLRKSALGDVAPGVGRYLRMGVAGAAVGLLTGLLGVGGGFLIVPALTLILRLPMALAVGTSLVMIALNSTTALAVHLTHESLDWILAGAFAAMTMVTATIASRYSLRLPEQALRQAFCSLIVAAATTMVASVVR